MHREPHKDLEIAKQCLRLWNERSSDVYRLRFQDLEWNFQEQNWMTYRVSETKGETFLWSEASAIGALQGIHDKGLWIPLWIPRVQKEGLESLASEMGLFLERAAELAVARRKSRLHFGGDEFHFLPGLPVDGADGEEIRHALASQGFQGILVGDLAGDLSNEQIDEYLSTHLNSPAASGLHLRLIGPEYEAGSFADQMKNQFPGRWAREFQFWIGRQDMQRARWLALVNGSGQTLGFARVALRSWGLEENRGWTPGALRMPLSIDGDFLPSDCSLGPIGVWSAFRGKGFGNILLALTLMYLREAGGGRICIDWTNAFKYYEPLGLNLIREYWSGSRTL